MTDEPTTTATVLTPSDLGLEAFELEHEAALADVPAGGAALLVTRGPNAGSRFVLAPDDAITTIGRHPDSDIFLDDITVSRRHAEVRRQEAVYWAHDVGSLNGTYLNRQRIDNTPLASGDELQVGKFRLLFLAPSPSSGTA